MSERRRSRSRSRSGRETMRRGTKRRRIRRFRIRNITNGERRRNIGKYGRDRGRKRSGTRRWMR